MRCRAAAAVCGLSLAALPRPAAACAPAPPEGASVVIAQEEAVIVWDDAKKLEHFVRRAVFDTKARDFGFLVPTPTQPELAEASDAVFATLLQRTRPEIRHETVRDLDVGCWTLGTLGRSAGAPEEVAAGAAP